MSVRVLHLRIDKVVVDGLPASAQRRFVSSLERRLGEMAKSGIPMSGAASVKRISSVDAGTMRAGGSADQAAKQIVQACQQRLTVAKGGHHG